MRACGENKNTVRDMEGWEKEYKWLTLNVWDKGEEVLITVLKIKVFPIVINYIFSVDINKISGRDREKYRSYPLIAIYTTI